MHVIFIFLQVGLIILFLIFQVTPGARREHTQATIKPITFSFLILQITLGARGEHTWRGYQFPFPGNGAKMSGQFSVV